MASIYGFSQVDSLTAGDQFALYSAQAGGDRKAALSLLMAYVQDNYVETDNWESLYFVTGAITLNPTVPGRNMRVIVTPSGGISATILLPSVATLVDRQIMKFSCTQAVTLLVVQGNGATVNGAPSSLGGAANGFFELQFDLATSTWYRVG